ncbi:MAG: chemotaxis protein CheY [Actinobacteria bacterium]|nr:chemotaxis protein CheY [Actinomycetota bacterium]NCA26204.1 chemotaxis protein CheY [Actinomycetota bacterium]NCZ77278.1 chemotaxis protein CheY [Actinomycetota bacterium]
MDINILMRELTPFEKLVCEHLCDGLTNGAIARATAHTEKVIENTVSRVAHAFSIKSNGEINVRVLLALAYRAHFGDKAFDKLGVTCSHLVVAPNGGRICGKHTD